MKRVSRTIMGHSENEYLGYWSRSRARCFHHSITVEEGLEIAIAIEEARSQVLKYHFLCRVATNCNR